MIFSDLHTEQFSTRLVVLVRRQITLVDEGEEEEEELCLKEDVVLVTDKSGVTDTVCADTVVMETNEIFL